MHEIFALVCDIYSFRQRAKIVDACIAEHANPLQIVDVERGGSFILDKFSPIPAIFCDARSQLMSNLVGGTPSIL